MKKRPTWVYVVCGSAALLVAVGLYFRPRDDAEVIEEYDTVTRAARISPGYEGVVIPPNICPLNFVVKEPGGKYCVNISAERGKPIEIFSRSGEIAIPLGPWKDLLGANRGGKLTFDVYVKSGTGRWSRFAPLTNTIAREDIDGYLVYREMPVYNLIWTNMGIYQRNLQNHDESVVLHNRHFGLGCCNCHTFLKNSPKHLAMNVRRGREGSPHGGLLIARDGIVTKVVDTKTPFNPIPAIYLAWHPSGKAIGFSTNKINQSFHAFGDNRHSTDSFSDMAVYLIESNTVTTTPEIARPDRLETSPAWSPDGRYMYFCSAPRLPIERYKEFRYELMRIAYDIETNTWGKPETVLSSKKTGLSIAFPQFSPDGRWLLFCMCEYGNFPVYQRTSDLYMMEMSTGKYWPLDVNSDQSESWHSWSSNSRWIVFSSKRPEGLLTRPYFSYIDAEGKAHKPFVLPQKDPAFYDSHVRMFNYPELIKEPIGVGQRDLLRALYSPAKQQRATLDPKLVRPEGATGATRQVPGKR